MPQIKATNDGMDDGLADFGAGAKAGAGGGELKFHSETKFVMATCNEAEAGEDNRGEKKDAAGGKNPPVKSVLVSSHHTLSRLTSLLLDQPLLLIYKIIPLS